MDVFTLDETNLPFGEYPKETKYGVTEMLEYFLAEKKYPSDKIVEYARCIKHYFAFKYTALSLKGKQLTNFQTIVSELVTDIRKVKTDEIGVVYKLIDFYEHDIIMDDLLIEHPSDNPRSAFINGTRDLTYLNKTIQICKRIKRIRYWFRNGDNILYRISMSHLDQLIPLLDHYIKANDGLISIDGKFTVTLTGFGTPDHWCREILVTKFNNL